MGIAIPEILTQAVGFILLVFLLKKFAWKPLLQLLDARREKIRTGLEDIEKTKQEVETLKAEYSAHQAKIEEEVSAKLQHAVDEGRQIAKELQEKARVDAREVLEKAKADIQLEADKAKISLREEISDLVLAATEKLVEQKLDATKDKELVLNFIKDVEKIK